MRIIDLLFCVFARIFLTIAFKWIILYILNYAIVGGKPNMDYKVSYDNWLTSPYLCDEGLKELKAIEGDDKAIEYAFGAELEFGTGVLSFPLP